MKARFQFVAILALIAALPGPLAPISRADSNVIDIKHAAPPDAFLAVYAKHNPARDYQRQYYADALKTFQDEKIGERILKIITSTAPPDKLAAAKSKLEELQTALEPIDLKALADADEMVMIEVMQAPFNHVLVGVRLKPDAAAGCERGLVQAMQLASQWSEGKLVVDTSHMNAATVTTMALPPASPFQPAVARLGDIVLVSTNVALLRTSVELLQNPTAKSKFDDPRLQEALTHLPKPDDSLVFLDGRKLFADLRGIGDFVRSHAGTDKDAQRVAHLLDRVIDEVSIIDYQVTVQYTEPGRNRKTTLGKLTDDYQSKLLGKALMSAQPLDKWQTWVPADATAFEMHTGANLHEIYDGIVKLVRDVFPESERAFEKLDAVQQQIGVNLDRDILQSFSGEAASVTLPITKGSSTGHDSVTALKCSNPDRIRELIGRGVEALNRLPAVQMQQLKLEDCADLPGFQKLSAAFLQMFSAQPVIGFKDGWMIIGTSQQAAEKLLAVRSGKADSFASTPAFAEFEKIGLAPNDPASAVSYRDIGAQVRQAADMLNQIGATLPMFLSMAAANAKPEELKPVQEAISLLPSIAKVVRKFDFFGHSFSIARKGPTPNTYLRESVTEVPMPKAEAPAN
jgi:hypothetical protein